MVNHLWWFQVLAERPNRKKKNRPTRSHSLFILTVHDLASRSGHPRALIGTNMPYGVTRDGQWDTLSRAGQGILYAENFGRAAGPRGMFV